MLRIVSAEPDAPTRRADTDPRDPLLYRTGIATARAALRQGVARRHDRDLHDDHDEHDEHDDERADDQAIDGADGRVGERA